MGLAFIKRRHNHKQDRRSQHDPDKEHKVTVSLQLHAAVRILDEEIDRGSKSVAERDGEQIRAHDQRFEFYRPLRVGKLKVRWRNQRLAHGQNYERPNLPSDAWLL